ncbi:fibroblast growth factor receptor 1-like [Patiria miniata]|uniref:receptor protein-tyrosine kinase n=1 Tax=Patiria miniata TaxID=46514 RepID=A0A914AF89_PATMI|nr:fibroblast growth factor receptor 1-like [Patiria miniata]
MKPLALASTLTTSKKRIADRLDDHIPVSQAPYQHGRGTTEQVFALMISAEKAITADSYELHPLLLDMSKAFDSPKKVTNKELYRRTNEIPWSTAITRRRLSWTGHLLRKSEETPAEQALLEAIRKNKLPRGGQRTTLLKRVNKDLTTTGVNIKDRHTWHVASDREQNDVVSQGADSELPPLPVTDQSSPGLDPDHPDDIPLEPIASAVVCESISNEDSVEASNDVAYGNVGPKLSFSRDLVVIKNELGRGEFGRVLLGKALGIVEAGKETKVAVKTVKEGADRHAKNELLAELQVMKTVGSHPNVVKLLGFCAEKDPIYVIVEYLAKGDLKSVLMEYRDKDPGTGYANVPGLSKSLSRTLIKFARDVANGMAYISSQKFVHRDLAARNVLVGEDMVCKVSDFGLARDVMNTRIYHRKSQCPLPIRWMALECIVHDVYTTKSDVWSFGILLWEIVTLGARPYPLMTPTTMINVLQRGYRMPRPRQCKKKLYKMMRSCWQEIPKDRPSFQSLYWQFADMASKDEDYLTMKNLDERIYKVKGADGMNEKL